MTWDKALGRTVWSAPMLTCLSLLVTAWQRAKRMLATLPAPRPSGSFTLGMPFTAEQHPFTAEPLQA
jgi:hypothetical protein